MRIYPSTEFLLSLEGIGGGELVWGGIFAGGILNVFPCRARTKGPMDKWGLQLDSARRIGLEPILTEFLILG